ncbi:MAG: hypothetical protein RID91_08405 [Azospirillaceae bacterium]
MTGGCEGSPFDVAAFRAIVHSRAMPRKTTIHRADTAADRKARPRTPGVAERLLAIGDRYSRLPDLDMRSDEAILGYDDMERGP